MEIFIFKFPYIANYEIISVGLAVVSFCLLDIVTLTYSKQSAPWTGSGGKRDNYRQTPFVQVHLYRIPVCARSFCVEVLADMTV